MWRTVHTPALGFGDRQTSLLINGSRDPCLSLLLLVLKLIFLQRLVENDPRMFDIHIHSPRQSGSPHHVLSFSLCTGTVAVNRQWKPLFLVMSFQQVQTKFNILIAEYLTTSLGIRFYPS